MKFLKKKFTIYVFLNCNIMKVRKISRIFNFNYTRVYLSCDVPAEA